MDLRYELFSRLNTGGSPLKEQEIRNCVFRGVSNELNNTLKELSKDINFIELIKPTEKQLSELYLEELVLRFISLVDKWEDINSMISIFMTNYMKKVVSISDFNHSHFKELFRRTISIIPSYKCLRGRNHSFSTSLFDCIFIGVGLNIELFEELNSTDIQEKLERIRIDDVVKSTMGSNSASKTNVRIRIERTLDIIAE